MTIANFYLAISFVSIVSIFLYGPPLPIEQLCFAGLSIAILGVPHGGLDHWTGRRLLTPYLSQRWWLLFFPAYLFVAFVFAAGWLAVPVFTVILFFLASAWHFGREDEKTIGLNTAAESINCCSAVSRPVRVQQVIRFAKSHIAAVAIGGLILWIPALLRGEEMRSLLVAVVPEHTGDSAHAIVTMTKSLALLFLPIASLVVLRRIATNVREVNHWIPLVTAVLATATPILVSFAIFFCCWHSLHGLQHLKREEGLNNIQFLRAVVPLSAMAVAGIAVTGWYFHGRFAAPPMAINATDQASLQVLFIGLSAIAIPHLLLHGIEPWFGVHRKSDYSALRERLGVLS